MGRVFFSLITASSLFLSFSCESRLYPPTYPPVFSGIVLTSTSVKTSTDSVYQGDTVFISVNVEDPEDDPSYLNVSLKSGDTEVMSKTVSDSRIFDGTVWETWLETDEVATGTYTLILTATDKEENEGDPVSTSLTLTDDIRSLVTTADIAVSGVTHTVKDDVSGEPYTITFSVTNNSAVQIDWITVPFTVNMEYDNPLLVNDGGITDPSQEYYTGNGIVTSLAAGDTKTGYLRLNIQNTDRTFVSETFAAADCTITIY